MTGLLRNISNLNMKQSKRIRGSWVSIHNINTNLLGMPAQYHKETPSSSPEDLALKQPSVGITMMAGWEICPVSMLEGGIMAVIHTTMMTVPRSID